MPLIHSFTQTLDHNFQLKMQHGKKSPSACKADTKYMLSKHQMVQRVI